KLTTAFAVTPQFSAVDNDGIVHYLAYADPSDGTTPSIINTDYVELEIELKPNADFHNPKVPLYEVTQAEYNKILTDWDANEVINRFPSVEGVQHVVNPVVSVSGGNLLPPFTEWTLHANAKVVSPYELELNATGGGQRSGILINSIAGQQVTLTQQEEAS